MSFYTHIISSYRFTIHNDLTLHFELETYLTKKRMSQNKI